MSDLNETFFTSVGCMDGRVQIPVAEYGKKKFGALFADTITEAGLVGLLANNPSPELLESIKKKLLISIEKHHSKGIVVHGHEECAGNLVEDKVHRQNVLKAVAVLRSMVNGIEIVPLFVAKKNGHWVAQEI